jgi:hypothetical protein
MEALARRYHLKSAQLITRQVRKHEDPFTDALLNLSNYANLIIPPPSFEFLQRLLGPTHAMLTRLIDPQRASGQVLYGISQGWDRLQIGKELERIFGGYEVAARRVTRTEGLRVATETQLAVSETIPDLVIGYEISAVLDERTRPEHRKRDRTRYYRNPKGKQLGLDAMPHPPVEADGRLSHNCRCYLFPLFGEGIDD